MMIPELMIVGPGIQPCSIADAQRRVGIVPVVAHVADDGEAGASIWMPFDTAWIARSGVES